jgi:hypothetical protein
MSKSFVSSNPSLSNKVLECISFDNVFLKVVKFDSRVFIRDFGLSFFYGDQLPVKGDFQNSDTLS